MAFYNHLAAAYSSEAQVTMETSPVYSSRDIRVHQMGNQHFQEWLPSAWMGREFAGEQIHVYIWLGPYAVHLKLSHSVNRLYSNIK